MSPSSSAPPPRALTPALLATMVIAVSVAVLAADRQPPAAWLHAVFAAALLPLILAAMAYFAPVLTRRPAAPLAIGRLPWLAAAGGVLTVAGLLGRPALLAAGGALGLLAAAALLIWMSRQARRALGGAHPGLAWYQAALGCLAAALLAMLVALAFPDQWPGWRRLHLHLNLLGFVGLTAIGTLTVLLPTAGGYADAHARTRLRRDLGPAVAGAVTAALASALYPPLAWVGAALWLLPSLRLAAAVIRQRRAVARLHGAATSLAAALLGWLLTLATGVLHGFGLADPRQGLLVFFTAFLFPLVTGALTHLAPVWLRPEATTAAHAALRTPLARGSGVRAAGFLAAGVLALNGISWAPWLALAALGVFLAQLGWFLWKLTQRGSPARR